jgi:3-dehydroquinate dehydratase type I
MCVELRLDFLGDRGLGEAPGIVSRLKERGYVVVSTIRSLEEGGSSGLPVDRVVSAYEELLESGSDYVDLEHRRVSDGVLEAFRGRGILSIHSYAEPLDAGLLAEVVGRARRHGMIAKIAVAINDARTLSSLVGMAGEAVTVVGLGKYSIIARALSLARGSRLTFAAHPEGPVVAPGQPLPEEIIAVYELVRSSC